MDLAASQPRPSIFHKNHVHVYLMKLGARTISSSTVKPSTTRFTSRNVSCISVHLAATREMYPSLLLPCRLKGAFVSQSSGLGCCQHQFIECKRIVGILVLVRFYEATDQPRRACFYSVYQSKLFQAHIYYSVVKDKISVGRFGADVGLAPIPRYIGWYLRSSFYSASVDRMGTVGLKPTFRRLPFNLRPLKPTSVMDGRP